MLPSPTKEDLEKQVQEQFTNYGSALAEKDAEIYNLRREREFLQRRIKHQRRNLRLQGQAIELLNEHLRNGQNQYLLGQADATNRAANISYGFLFGGRIAKAILRGY